MHYSKFSSYEPVEL